jgi:hypothetical protein
VSTEPGAFLSREPRHLNVAGARIVIPFSPAALWLPQLEYPYYAAQAMTDDDGREALEDVLIEVPGAEDALKHASLDLIREVTGRARWWEGTRLASLGADPDFMGHLILAGVDPWTRSLGEWCAAAYTVATKDADRVGQERFRMRLSFPPVGHEDEWETEDEYAAMEASMADLPGMD